MRHSQTFHPRNSASRPSIADGDYNVLLTGVLILDAHFGGHIGFSPTPDFQ
jgi:hypothetical protein